MGGEKQLQDAGAAATGQLALDTGADDGEEPSDAIDPLYTDGVMVVRKHRRASISLIQRHLRVGYNRAAHLLESMERAGLVTAMQSNGSRELRA
ncbi:DNA translocase FtsK [Achromobacter insolitus]|uniref:DNA translocase FtsK n=1 Tax=Achromobacter insolitus TaxID=217204 RepID=UPI0027E175D6|nr:DNA translocase FtsK [Achromobacter insolitus]